MKTAFIIHGFNGDTTYTFGPWLKQILENKGFTVYMPSFPIRSEASFEKWSRILDDYKNEIKKDSIIIAHSIGNPFIIRYLANNKLNVNTYISIAGFCQTFIVEGREDLNNAFEDFKVKKHHIESIKDTVPIRYSLYGDKDHVIPIDILKNFVEQLESVPVFIEGIGHMGNRDNVKEIPKLAEIIKNVI